MTHLIQYCFLSSSTATTPYAVRHSAFPLWQTNHLVEDQSILLVQQELELIYDEKFWEGIRSRTSGEKGPDEWTKKVAQKQEYGCLEPEESVQYRTAVAADAGELCRKEPGKFKNLADPQGAQYCPAQSRQAEKKRNENTWGLVSLL